MLKALYRAAIRLMPADYRATYGEEQWRLFEQVLAEEAPRNRVGKLVWSCDLLGRAYWAAMQVHVDRRHSAKQFQQGAWAIRGGGGSMHSDLKFTWRSVKSAPWYGAAVIVVTAVTVALATTTFTVVDGVLFRPLPYPAAGQLVSIEPNFATVPPPVYRDRATFQGCGSSEVDVKNWQAAVPDVPVTGYRAQPWSGLGPSMNDSTAGLALVQPNFFDVVGVWPLIGGLKPEDFLEEAKVRPVIISYDAWMSRFDGDSHAVGREIITEPAGGWGIRIVGVMPKGFTFPSARTDVTFISALVSNPKTREDPKNRQLSEVIARMPAGMTRAVLQERLMNGVAVTAAAFPPQGPRPDGWSDNSWRRQGAYDAVKVVPLSESLGRSSRPFFVAVFAAVVLLMAIAASNIASLMSARALERQQEIGVRRSLGAGAWAVARLWTIEATSLVVAGGVLGALATPVLMSVMLQLLPEDVVLLKPAQLDWRVAGFTMLTLALMVVLVAVAPIRRSLTSGGTQNRGASERVRTPGRLIVIGSQVGVAFVLTVVGACLVGSLMTVYAKELPIQVEGVVALDVMLQGGGISPERAQRESRIRARLAQVSGTIAVAATSAQVLKGGGALPEFEAPVGKKTLVNQDMWGVTEGFYDVIAPQVVEGRLPTNDELRTSAPLLVVSAQVARAYWPDGPAVGQTLKHWPSKAVFTVIGVVKDVRWLAWDLESPIIYAPYATTARYPWLTYFIRTNANTGRVTADAINAIAEADRLATPRRSGTLDSVFRESVSLRRFQSWLFGGFAGAALLVVGVGVCGLLAMSTARRTKEVGIRCALGATPNSVATLIVREQAMAVTVGLIAGGAVAAWAVGFVKGYLYEITVTDPRIWLSAIGLILLTALLGAMVPALRASRIDPLKALRVE
jgi:predicted permease